MERVVAPVEAVEIADRLEARLLLGRRRTERGEVARRRGLRRAVLLDRRDVERRQQVHGVDAGLGELRELLCSRRVASEGAIGAALRLWHGLVGDREVAHVQFVDRAVDRALDDRRGRLGPLLGCEGRVVEVDDDRARRVRGEGDRVRVGHGVRLDGARGRCVDLERPAVLAVRVDDVVADRPRAVGLVERRRDHRGLAGRPGRPHFERDVARGGRPQAQGRLVARPVDAEGHGCHGVGVEVVEHSGQLHAGEGGELVAGALRHRELLGEELLHRGAVDAGGMQREEALELRELRELLLGEPGRIELQLHRFAATGDGAVGDRQRRGIRVLDRPTRLVSGGSAEQ